MWLDNKKILITGGTGTIGSALLRSLLEFNTGNIYVFSRDEQKQDAEHHFFKKYPKIYYIIGDIKEYDSINCAMKDIDIVFHTAAMKIVRACEYNPTEAFKTNIIGTENIIKAAIANNVEKVIFTSSDKAANPTTALGIGKLYAERLISHANFIKGNNTVFSTVRFGNVLGSRGCVLDLFCNQIMSQNYVTVTHPDMSRFICTINQSVELLINSAEYASGGEIFIKKMPSIRIIDLAETLIEHLAPLYSKDPHNIKIQVTEKQSSEKLYEELITPHEAERSFEFRDYYCILPTIHQNKVYLHDAEICKPVTGEISSNICKPLTKEELLAFLLQNNLI